MASPEESLDPVLARCATVLDPSRLFCPAGPCEVVLCWGRVLRSEAEDAIRSHRIRTGLAVDSTEFWKNACRTAHARQSLAIDESLRAGLLESLRCEDLYLVTGLSTGDPAAWRAFWSRYERLLRSACRATGLSEQAADEAIADLVFDLFAKRALARFLGSGALAPWLRQCAVFAARRQFRGRAAGAPLDSEWIADRAQDVVLSLMEREEVERLGRALQTLSEADRRVLGLRFADGLTLSETARILGLRHAMSAARLVTRALEHLRLRLMVGDPGGAGARGPGIRRESGGTRLDPNAEASSTPPLLHSPDLSSRPDAADRESGEVRLP